MFFRKRRKQHHQTTFDTKNYDDYLKQKMHVNKLNQLPVDLKQVELKLNEIFEHSDDFTKRIIQIPSGQTAHVYYFEGLVNDNQLDDSVITPFIRRNESNNKKAVTKIEDVVYSVSINKPSGWYELIQNCLEGQVICHIEQLQPINIAVQSEENRSLTNPETEYQVYGPKVGFIEDISVNVSLIRRYIQDPRLKVRERIVGSLSRTRVNVLYLQEYVDPDLVDQVLSRIDEIDIDNLVQSGELIKYVVDYPMAIFPQIRQTERPDTTSIALSQGKMAILVNNSTMCLILPVTFLEMYEVGEDNYMMPWNMTFVKVLRIISIFFASVLPALYVAVVGFHPELLPTTLALTIAESRHDIPFPAPAEALIMMIALDVLVESSIRLPSPIGQTIGIVGGIVIGTAAVEAGVVSSLMIIVIAFTAVSSFTGPTWSMVQSWRLIRYLLLLISSMFGLFGLMLGICLLTIHLCHLNSLAKPYYSPLSPLNPLELFNYFVRWQPKNNNKSTKH